MFTAKDILCLVQIYPRALKFISLVLFDLFGKYATYGANENKDAPYNDDDCNNNTNDGISNTAKDSWHKSKTKLNDKEGHKSGDQKKSCALYPDYLTSANPKKDSSDYFA